MARFRFVFMADCQLGCYATFSGMDAADVARFAARDMRVEPVPAVSGFAWDADRYARAIDAARNLRPDFVVMGGDMVDDPGSAEQRQALMDITAGLSVPMYWIPGNHDAAEDTVVPTPESLRRYRETFGPDHYGFDHKGVSFVATDTVVWQHPEKVDGELAAQAEALTERLSAARSAGRPIVAFGHHPLFTRSPDEPDDYWNIPRARRKPLLDTLTRFGVLAFFCGHWHRNGGGRAGGLEVAVTGPVGYPLGSDPSGFRVVDVDGDRLRHRYVPLDGG